MLLQPQASSHTEREDSFEFPWIVLYDGTAVRMTFRGKRGRGMLLWLLYYFRLRHCEKP